MKWRESNQENKDGCAGGGELDLSLCAPPAVLRKKIGSSAKARPDSRVAIHVGAPVASQQSRILCVNGMSVATNNRAGKVPAQNR
jgi:hypothetical protein